MRKTVVLETVTGLIALVAVVYAGIVGAMFLFQRSLLYHPADGLPSPADSGVAEMRLVSLRTEDGLDLKSWYAPAPAGRPVVVYFCGNAGHLGTRGFKARVLLDASMGLLLVSYRGYGGNPGEPSEEGLYADGRAALAFLKNEGVEPDRTVIYGESLGTGVAVHLAYEQAQAQPVAGVVLETPYTSITDVAAAHYPFAPVRWLVKDKFDAAAKISKISAPLLVFHANNDQVIPVRFAKGLFEAAAQPKTAEWYDLGGHDGLFDNGAGRLVVEFINGVFAGK
ncbi:MAG: alpha/beta hydrolase [Alphaproteobacteria bacterium]|nr:alpha/beta hydrolase [Alphaproteobacteria bacterium]